MDLTSNSYADKLDISVSGTTPTGGYLNYENSILKDGCLTMDEYKVIIENGEVTTTEKGSCESVSLTACDSPNFKPSPEEWFSFDASTNTITGFSDTWDGTTDITIPCQIGGVDVINIGAGRFIDRGLTSVIISDSVIKLEAGSFGTNSELTSLIIGESVEEIGDSSFYNCNIKNLVLPDSIKIIGNLTFENNGLKSVSFGENVKSIGNQAFYKNELMELIIPKSVESIGSAAFIDNDLTNIVINSDDITIAQPAFFKSSTSNSNLTTIYNNTGKSFDWGSIINGTSGYNFETGIVENEYGNVEVKKLN